MKERTRLKYEVRSTKVEKLMNEIDFTLHPSHFTLSQPFTLHTSNFTLPNRLAKAVTCKN
jgi:hypothetical protein